MSDYDKVCFGGTENERFISTIEGQKTLVINSAYFRKSNDSLTLFAPPLQGALKLRVMHTMLNPKAPIRSLVEY